MYHEKQYTYKFFSRISIFRNNNTDHFRYIYTGNGFKKERKQTTGYKYQLQYRYMKSYLLSLKCSKKLTEKFSFILIHTSFNETDGRSTLKRLNISNYKTMINVFLHLVKRNNN